jgi:hypothetical protein
MDTTCVNCNKTFSSKYSLGVHQKSAKSCGGNHINKITYDCEYCKKQFSSSSNLKTHIEICSVKKEIDKLKEKEEQNKQKEEEIKEILKHKDDEFQEILKQKEEEFKTILNEKEKELTSLLRRRTAHFTVMEEEFKQELASNKNNVVRLETIIDQLEKQLHQTNEKSATQISELQDKLERLVRNAIDKKTVTNNNTTNNIVDVKYVFPSQEKINQLIQDKFTYNHLICGPKGVAKFVYDEIIRTDDGELLYKCYDVSRQIYVFYNDLGEEVKDVKGYKLIEMINPGIIKRSVELKAELELEYDRLKAKGFDRTPDETDRMCFLKSANETRIPMCIADIRLMKNKNTLSCELSRLTS